MVFVTAEGIGKTPPHPPSRSGRWTLGASLAIHVAIGLALLLVSVPRSKVPPSDDGVTVDVLTPEQFEKANGLPVEETPARKTDDVLPATVPDNRMPEFAALLTDRAEVHGSTMIRATRLMSAAVLGDPRSAKARKAMKGLAASERIVQLCNIEAMAQIHAWKASFQPDFLIAYAMAETELSGTRLQADGAAFRSNQHWYNAGFTCDVTADLTKVNDFSFLVGAEIPKSEWQDHNLAADDGPVD